jgi:hypothetical protein
MAKIAPFGLDEEAIQATMTERNVGRAEAIVILGLRHGDLDGDGDLLSLYPLTAAQRRRLGIGRPPEEVFAELGEDEDR